MQYLFGGLKNDIPGLFQSLYALLNCQTPSISFKYMEKIPVPPLFVQVKKPSKAPKPNFLMKEPKVLSWEGGLKRREIVNLSPLFYALKRRRVHKFGFAALCALFLVGENCVKWSRQIELLLRSRFDCHLIFGVEGNDTWPNDGVPDPIPIQNHY